MKTLLFLLSEFIWIKSDNDIFKGPSAFLKGILNARKLVGKLVLTRGLNSRRFVPDDPSSAPLEMCSTPHKQRQIITALTFYIDTVYPLCQWDEEEPCKKKKKAPGIENASQRSHGLTRFATTVHFAEDIRENDLVSSFSDSRATNDHRIPIILHRRVFSKANRAGTRSFRAPKVLLKCAQIRVGGALSPWFLVISLLAKMGI